MVGLLLATVIMLLLLVPGAKLNAEVFDGVYTQYKLLMGKRQVAMGISTNRKQVPQNAVHQLVVNLEASN